MECSFGECWLERPILAFQQLCKNKTIQSKDIKKKFLKAMKNVQKQKKTKREDFKNNLSLYLSQCSESSSLEMDTNKTERNEALGSVVVKTLKKQFKHPAHCVANLLKDFFDIFACYYHSICTKNKQITKIYDQTVKFCNGEVSDMQDEINNTNYDLTISKEIRTQIEHSFIEIKSVLNIIIDTVPLFYSGLISKYSFILIKDELLNYFMSEYMGDKTYQLLFTFCRLLTLEKEHVLAKVLIERNDDQSENKLDLIERLYSQIDSSFRRVQIEKTSLFESIRYTPRDEELSTLTERPSKFNRASQADYIQLKYENASSKLSSLDYCKSPLEKIYMIKWVAESIKRDGAIICGDDETAICADTLIGIFAYISAQSSNHLLYSHLALPQFLMSGKMKDQSCEGYYLCILEGALSLLCEKMDKAHEMMVTICNLENSLDLEPINLKEEAQKLERRRKDLGFESDNTTLPPQSPTPTKNIAIFF